MSPTVLMVAEKPSIAESIAQILSNRNYHKRQTRLPVHEFRGRFLGQPADFRVTSVAGHVFSIDFAKQYNAWDVDPCLLFDAEVVRQESNPKMHVVDHLKTEARGCDYLVLWLDCDREGENICFEVIDCVQKSLNQVRGRQIYRARFSAISEQDIARAMSNLVDPNKNEALSVDARQEIDLKVGVAFTRFQTRYFQGKYGNLDSALISFGPCQTPTLGFCVERHDVITSFTPEPFWSLAATITNAAMGNPIELEWDRGRSFDQPVARMFQKKCEAETTAIVVECKKKEGRKPRPGGLNTVEMLKAASSKLDLGAHHAMKIAENLYLSGYITYPRTESTSYPTHFELEKTLAEHTRHPIWGEFVRGLLANGITKPKQGHDAGDHPPITPMKSATENELGGGDMWRLYDYIARNFIASCSPDCIFTKIKYRFNIAGETFTTQGKTNVRPGYTAIVPWESVKEEYCHNFTQGDSCRVVSVKLQEGRTSAPSYLTESDLIALMEKHGIGTDASIPTHINNVCERNYVSVGGGRTMIPTSLGIALVHGYHKIDLELVLPTVRSHIESEISLIAKGVADINTVVDHALRTFYGKFSYFMKHIDGMDELFEASFTTIADTQAKPMSLCGHCHRYMKYIPSKPQRLHCQKCEQTYSLPLVGQIKGGGSGDICPLDDFELVMCSTGSEGKTFFLCPHCFNNPPFEEIKKGMNCNNCPHPTCPNGYVSRSVCGCAECEGYMVIDPTSAPKWRMTCNTCNFMVKLPASAHKIRVTNDICECGSTMIEVDFHKKNTPLPEGKTLHVACVLCDELLGKLMEST